MSSFILPRTEKAGRTIASRTHALLELSVFLNKLSPEQPFEILVRKWRKSRTTAQNHALFGVAYKVIGEETGHTKDELHEAFCRRFFGTVEHEVFGVVQSRPRRTTTRDEHGKRDVLDWKVFGDFYAEVEATAASAGIRIPPPDPDWRAKPLDSDGR